MNILIINDDGYGAKGIEILKEKAKKYGEVFVIAPTHHQSGKSMAFSLNKGFTITNYNDHELSIDGTPTDCMLLAATLFPNKFDLVISGVNDGLNMSYDTVYSGTIGAALEAINQNIPSIALSTHFSNWTIIEEHLEEVLDYIILNKLYDKTYCINVNFPKDNIYKGIRLTREVKSNDKYYTWEESDGLHIDRNQDFSNPPTDSDIYAVHNGYVSINTIRPSYFSLTSNNILRNKMDNIN